MRMGWVLAGLLAAVGCDGRSFDSIRDSVAVAEAAQAEPEVPHPSAPRPVDGLAPGGADAVPRPSPGARGPVPSAPTARDLLQQVIEGGEPDRARFGTGARPIPRNAEEAGEQITQQVVAMVRRYRGRLRGRLRAWFPGKVQVGPYVFLVHLDWPADGRDTPAVRLEELDADLSTDD